MAGTRLVNDHDFWEALDLAKSALLSRFAEDGVVRVEFTVSFEEAPDRRAWPWLATNTDVERDSLAERATLVADANAVLAHYGLPASDGVTVQSEETVTRDYEGSWFYAMR
jgi:hypothetical protein